MIAIAESGSTKCDWVFVDQHNEVFLRTQSVGLNPYFHDAAFIQEAVLKATGISQVASAVRAVYFYGAGCSAPALNERVQRALNNVFSNAEVAVDHDLVASAYALYDGEPTIACILGTGSNSCYYDGTTLTEAVPALGFILGDEGSGSFIGKQLVADYFYGRMPKPICEAFDQKFALEWDDVVEHVYRNPRANVYLASFAKFVSNFEDEAYVQEMVKNGFDLFVKAHVLPFEMARNVPVGFVGSVAFAFQDILKDVLHEFDCRSGLIIKHPVDRLVKHHISGQSMAKQA